jgi:ElaB/YqjD/DUF883 family membrane-anchored ribosome-binding protein
VADELQSTESPHNLEIELEKARVSTARLLENLAAKLRGAPAVRDATIRISRAAQYVHDSSVKDMTAELNRIVRERPVASILVAAAAGFLAASALRRL